MHRIGLGDSLVNWYHFKSYKEHASLFLFSHTHSKFLVIIAEDLCNYISIYLFIAFVFIYINSTILTLFYLCFLLVYSVELCGYSSNNLFDSFPIRQLGHVSFYLTTMWLKQTCTLKFIFSYCQIQKTTVFTLTSNVYVPVFLCDLKY